jgi:hypothetical protein
MTGTRVNATTYAGEHDRAGWRKPKSRDNTDSVTKLFSPEERANATLVQDENGNFETAEGMSVKSDTLGYAMDPDTGEMVSFREGTKDEADVNGKKKVLNYHHSSVLGTDTPDTDTGDQRSRPAASAGHVKFDADGKIVAMSNISGHYKPDVTKLLQAMEYLSRQGAFFEDRVTGPDGRDLDPKSKEGQLFDAVQRQRQRHAQLLKQAAALQDRLEVEDITEEEAAAIAADMDELTKQIAGAAETLANASRMLGKLGVGPSQKMRAGVQAIYVEPKGNETGKQVHDLQLTSVDAPTFLRTGGGNEKQTGLKAQAMEELKKKRTPQAGEDANSVPGGPDPDEDAIEGARLRIEEDMAKHPLAANEPSGQRAGSRDRADAGSEDLYPTYGDEAAATPGKGVGYAGYAASEVDEDSEDEPTGYIGTEDDASAEMSDSDDAPAGPNNNNI